MAQGDNPCHLFPNQANRHGLIAGASGTGEIVTFKVMGQKTSRKPASEVFRTELDSPKFKRASQHRLSHSQR